MNVYKNNLKLIEDAERKSAKGEFNTAVEAHAWLYKNGYIELYPGHRIHALHKAEQLDAEYKEKRNKFIKED